LPLPDSNTLLKSNYGQGISQTLTLYITPICYVHFNRLQPGKTSLAILNAELARVHHAG
jgi:hypothetical protein